MINTLGCVKDDVGGAETSIEILATNAFTGNPMVDITFDLVEDSEGFTFASQEIRLETLRTDSLGTSLTIFITEAAKKYELRYRFADRFWPNSSGVVRIAEGETNFFEYQMKELVDIDVCISGEPSIDYNRVRIRIVSDDGLYFGQTTIRDIVASVDTTVVYRGANAETMNIEVVYYLNSEEVSNRDETQEIELGNAPMINVEF